MKRGRRVWWGPLLGVMLVLPATAQRQGGLDPGSITGQLLISNGPAGPIRGGESAVSRMILLEDGWVYGATQATWGAENFHLFRTDTERVEHVLDLTDRLTHQTRVTDLARGPDDTLIGSTSTSDEIFDSAGTSYPGGHLFSYHPTSGNFVDYGILSPGQGINCLAVDTQRHLIYAVTYPEGNLYSYDYRSGNRTSFGAVVEPWKVKDLGRVSWRGVPRVLILDDTGSVFFSTYVGKEGGRIFRLSPGDERPVFTGAVVPTQKGMHNDPIYENTISSAVRARDGGFWCGTSVDGFLFKFHPSTSTVINKGKAFNYWKLRSLAYGGDGKLYMLGGRDEDYCWLNRYDPVTGSIENLGWPSNTAQCGALVSDREGRILIGENLRNSYIWVYGKSR